MVVQGVEEVLSVSDHGHSLWGRHSWALFAERDRPVLADFGFPLGDELLQDSRCILVVLSLVAHLVQLLLKVEELLLQLGFALVSPRGDFTDHCHLIFGPPPLGARLQQVGSGAVLIWGQIEHWLKRGSVQLVDFDLLETLSDWEK